MGERRWRATQEAGLDRSRRSSGRPTTTTCCATRCWRTCTAAQLNPLEEAAAYQQLLDDFGCTHEELATRIGRSRPQISNTLRLLQAPAAGAAPGGRRRALGRPRPRAARRSTTPRRRSGWPSGSWPRALGAQPSRRSSPSVERPPATGRGARRSRLPQLEILAPGCPTASRLGSRSNWAGEGPDHSWSSGPSTTWSGSWR